MIWLIAIWGTVALVLLYVYLNPRFKSANKILKERRRPKISAPISPMTRPHDTEWIDRGCLKSLQTRCPVNPAQ